MPGCRRCGRRRAASPRGRRLRQPGKAGGGSSRRASVDLGPVGLDNDAHTRHTHPRTLRTALVLGGSPDGDSPRTRTHDRPIQTPARASPSLLCSRGNCPLGLPACTWRPPAGPPSAGDPGAAGRGPRQCGPEHYGSPGHQGSASARQHFTIPASVTVKTCNNLLRQQDIIVAVFFQPAF